MSRPPAVSTITDAMSGYDESARQQDSERGNNSAAAERPDWNRSWRRADMPTSVKVAAVGMLVALVAFAVIALPLMLTSANRVRFEHNAVLISTTGNVVGKAGPGLRFSGPGGKAVPFPRFDTTIEYTRDSGNPVNPRVEDGQIVVLDLSFQYNMPLESLVELYRLHKTGFETTLQSLARATLRDVAAAHASEAFFTNRSGIEAEMRARLVAEGRSRLIDITGFQIRAVELPTILTDRLIDVQMKQQEARARQEQLELDRITATNAAIELGLRTQREKGVAEYEQRTVVLLTEERQRTQQINERTRQLNTEIEETSRRDVSLFMRSTDVLEEAYRLDTSVAEEVTRREVDFILYNSQTNLTIYDQDTGNIQLEYDNRVALINEQTHQNVTGIYADTARYVETFQRELDVAVHRAQSVARQLLAEIGERVMSQDIEARRVGLLERPKSVYLASLIANGSLPHVQYFDVDIATLINRSLDV